MTFSEIQDGGIRHLVFCKYGDFDLALIFWSYYATSHIL